MKDLPAFLHFSWSHFLSISKKLNKSSVSVWHPPPPLKDRWRGCLRQTVRSHEFQCGLWGFPSSCSHNAPATDRVQLALKTGLYILLSSQETSLRRQKHGADTLDTAWRWVWRNMVNRYSTESRWTFQPRESRGKSFKGTQWLRDTGRHHIGF